MALCKELEVKNTGATASYWKLADIRINWYYKRALVILWGFKDKEARDAGKMPMCEKRFEFTETNFPFTYDGNNVAEAYTAIKSIKTYSPAGTEIPGEFADALDC